MLVVDCINYDVGMDNGSDEGLVRDVISKTRESWAQGADVVMFPEYTWMNAVQYTSPLPDRHQLAEIFWRKLFPILEAELSASTKTVILGSAPRLQDGLLYNTCPIISDRVVIRQDKLALTPWEYEFEGGAEIRTFKIGSYNCAVLICLDIEMPSIAQTLKDYGKIDILFVPSATENLMGAERIARCATARSVELACVVITSGLTGSVLNYPFIDSNCGRAAVYTPSLGGFENIKRVMETDVEIVGTMPHRFSIPKSVFENCRAKPVSTNPALIGPSNPINIL